MPVIFQPSGRRAAARSGTNLLDLAQNTGVDLSAVCGGAGVCGSCRVRVRAGAVSAPTALEADHLSAPELEAGLRLACQTELLATDAVISVPEESMRVVQRVLLDGRASASAVPAQGLIAVHDVRALPATTDDLRGDWERLVGCPQNAPPPPPSVLATLPPCLRAHDWQARLIMHSGRPVAFVPPGAHPHGLAVDVGTTSLAVYLIDLLDGTTLAAGGITNPQVSYGEDVMARLTTVMREPDKVRPMQALLVQAINELTQKLSAQAGIAPETIVDAVVAGNTAMHHLLFGLPVEQLGTAPYVPVVGAALELGAQEIGLRTAPGARLYAPPLVAGFVGADHVAMLLAAEMDREGAVTLALDIGTNTEISLRVGEQIVSCSAASGPAFEGAHIRDGMRAGAGAIERVAWDHGALRWLTIEDMPPVGLCGSGLLDLLGVLRAEGILNDVGAIAPDAPGYFRNGKVSGLTIVPAAQSGHQRPIQLQRADVSEMQMAKGAIRAGIKLLTEHVGIEERAIEQVIIAGAFGSYISIRHAIGIGMLPPLPESAFQQIGNAAGLGARALLLDTEARRRAAALAQRITYLELTTHPEFADRFSQAVLLSANPWD